jgi:hypothetical protein
LAALSRKLGTRRILDTSLKKAARKIIRLRADRHDVSLMTLI